MKTDPKNEQLTNAENVPSPHSDGKAKNTLLAGKKFQFLTLADAHCGLGTQNTNKFATTIIPANR